MEDTLINVSLYGDGSRKMRSRAEYVYCDHAKDCSLYKDGKCFCVTVSFGRHCPFGNIVSVDGGTKRSVKFTRVAKEVMESPCFNALEYPYHDSVAKIGDQFIIDLEHVNLNVDGEKIFVRDPGFLSGPMITGRIEILTPENLNRICEFEPIALMGGVIRRYQKEVIPAFLLQFKKLFPDEYLAFIEEYPRYQDVFKGVSYVGRRAKLVTCNRECKYFDGANEFHFDGEYMVCDKYRAFFNLFEPRFGAHYYQVRVKLDDSMVCKITDNAQVLPDTVFMD